jgi:hypothetical protein
MMMHDVCSQTGQTRKKHRKNTEKTIKKEAIRLPCRHRYRYLIQTENLWVSFKIWCPSVAC